ncbi:MAG: hypothetical protein JXA89_04145 [Anaerolineae bacterium]|nr:hypothetical protein [Anaerolineae bacterium]
MALPMVHLAVAHALVVICGYKSSPAFYLGSIAPDAIHMRSDIAIGDKQMVHLHKDGATDLERLQQLVTVHLQGSGDAAFAEGYCVHLLTDHYWFGEFVGPWRTRLGDNIPRHERRTLYYNECDKIDLDLYDQLPWRQDVWDLLQSAQADDFEGLLLQNEIELWRDRVLHWYDDNRHKQTYQPLYLTLEMALGFIGDASAAVCEQMGQWRQSVPDSR